MKLHYLSILPRQLFYCLLLASTLIACSDNDTPPTPGIPPIHMNVSDSLAMIEVYQALGMKGWDLKDIYTWVGVTGEANDPTTNEIRIVGFEAYAFSENPKETIPEALKKLTELRILVLTGRNLEGNIPEWLGEMENLQYLALGESSRISGPIPPQLGNLKKLQQLKIVSCNVSGEIPKELGNLENLTQLEICKTKVSGTIPKELAKLKKLEKVLFMENQLSGTFPIEIVSDKEFYMNCDDNCITELPFDFWKDECIGEVILTHNMLTGKIPDFVFKTKKWKWADMIIGEQKEGYGYDNYSYNKNK